VSFGTENNAINVATPRSSEKYCQFALSEQDAQEVVAGHLYL